MAFFFSISCWRLDILCFCCPLLVFSYTCKYISAKMELQLPLIGIPLICLYILSPIYQRRLCIPDPFYHASKSPVLQTEVCSETNLYRYLFCCFCCKILLPFSLNPEIVGAIKVCKIWIIKTCNIFYFFFQFIPYYITVLYNKCGYLTQHCIKHST